MSDCKKYQLSEWVDQFLLGQLSAHDEQKYQAHLEKCEKCQLFVEQEQLLISGIRAAGKSQMKLEIIKQSRLAQNKKKIRNWQTAMAAAAILLIVVLTPTSIYYYQRQIKASSEPVFDGTVAQGKEMPRAESANEKAYLGIPENENNIPGKSDFSESEKIIADIVPPEPTIGTEASGGAGIADKKADLFEEVADAVPENDDIITEPKAGLASSIPAEPEQIDLQPVEVSVQPDKSEPGKIQGKILDENLNPIVGANVWLESTVYGSATDAEGNFIILNVPPGEYNAQVQRIGYSSSRVEDISLKGGDFVQLDDTLEVAAFAAEAIVLKNDIISKDKEATISDLDVESFAGTVEESGYAMAPPQKDSVKYYYDISDEDYHYRSSVKKRKSGKTNADDSSNILWLFRSENSLLEIQLIPTPEAFQMDPETGLPGSFEVETQRINASEIYMEWYIPGNFVNFKASEFSFLQPDSNQLIVKYRDQRVYEIDPTQVKTVTRWIKSD